MGIVVVVVEAKKAHISARCDAEARVELPEEVTTTNTSD